MYNFALAFVICAVAYVIGEVVSTLTKAWVPSVFVTAVIFIIGYWYIWPTSLITDAALIPFGSTTGIYLILVHMGTVISLKQLAEQWKVIVVCLAGLAGMCAACLLICPLMMDRSLVISGLPPLTGGIVAAVTMQTAAAEKGLAEAALFAIAMYCVQGFAGYPLTAVCLQLEGRRLLKVYHEKGGTAGAVGSVSEDGALETNTKEGRRLIPAVPEKFDSAVVNFLKMGIAAWIATQIGAITGISGAVWALVIGIILTTIGFLDKDILHRCNSYGIVMFALMMYIFDGLKDSTPEMLASIVLPMIELIVIGVAGMGILCFVVSKILRMSFLLAFATALTALYGFPPNAIITESVCTALAQNKEEKDYLMSKMFPAMIVGGFVTVTITSVIIAGAFANML